MTKDEALKLALEAMEKWDARGRLRVIAAIKEALAQPSDSVEQEPAAWMTFTAYGDEDDVWYENPEGKLLEGWTYKPLYAHPPKEQPEEESLEYWNAVEGWVKIDEVRKHFGSVGCSTIYKTAGEGRVPLCMAQHLAKPPPKREWVGLTYKEIMEIDSTYYRPMGPLEFSKLLEDKLKEKNYDDKTSQKEEQLPKAYSMQ